MAVLTRTSRVAGWLVLVLLFRGESAAQEPTTVYRFDVDVDTVYVDVFVTRDGAPVTGLASSRFEIYDNGVKQRLELVSRDVAPLTTMLLLDISGSVSGEKLDDLRKAAHAFVDGLDSKDRVGLISFTRRMRLLSDVTSDASEIHDALDETMEAGETGLNDALFAALTLVEDIRGRPLVLVFSDGLENTSWLDTSEVLEELSWSEAVVHVVAVATPQTASRALVGRSRKRGSTVIAADYLEDLTGLTGGRVWSVESTTELREMYLRVLREMKNRYILSYQPEGIPLQGRHELRVHVEGFGDDQVRFRPAYRVP